MQRHNSQNRSHLFVSSNILLKKKYFYDNLTTIVSFNLDKYPWTWL